MSLSFEDYLSTFAATAGQVRTHTRLGGKGVGGTYCVPQNKTDAFYRAYYDHMFKHASPVGSQTLQTIEHLTELKLPADYTNAAGEHASGAIVIDMDFRYDPDIRTRQHTKFHIDNIIRAYTEELRKYFKFEGCEQFNIFVCEKDTVNCGTSITKDGIHIIIGIQAECAVQERLQKSIMPTLSDKVFSHLPLKNTHDSIIDDTITKGLTPWQLFGSRKPEHAPYRLKYMYNVWYYAANDEFGIECETFAPNSVISYNLFMRLSARYDAHPRFPLITNIPNDGL